MARSIPTPIYQAFQKKKMEYGMIAQKTMELDSEKHEHELVIKELSKLPKDRRCLRSVNGVIVERTVGEVLPAITKNKEQLEESVKALKGELQQRDKELSEFAYKYGLIETEEEDDDHVVVKKSPESSPTSSPATPMLNPSSSSTSSNSSTPSSTATSASPSASPVTSNKAQ